MGIMPGRPCGMSVNSTIAVLSISEHVMRRLPLSSTRCTSQFQCHRLPSSSMSQSHLHRILCTGRRWFTTNPMSFNTTAMKATPTGTLDGLHTRSLGAVTTEAWDAQEPGTAATTFTLTFFAKGVGHAEGRIYDCGAGFSNWMQGWSDSKKDWCCNHQSKGCVKFHCTSGAAACLLWHDKIFPALNRVIAALFLTAVASEEHSWGEDKRSW